MMPLTHHLRRRLLVLCAVLFVVGTPILIGYSKGYRLDDAMSLIETGGVYLHSDIANTSVFLDGGFVESNGAFLRNTYIEDLTPGTTYEIWVTRSGYQSWVKHLSVQANLVTEARVLMLPQTFTWTTVASTTTLSLTDGAVASGTRAVANPAFTALQEAFSTHDQFAVEVATTTYVLVHGKRVATTTVDVEYQFPTWLTKRVSSTILATMAEVRERDGIIAWLDHGTLVATWSRDEDPPPFYFCTTVCKKYVRIEWSEPIERYDFYPNRNDVVVVSTERGIYAVELDDRPERNIQPILEGPGLDFRFDADGTLIVYDGAVYRKTTW